MVVEDAVHLAAGWLGGIYPIPFLIVKEHAYVNKNFNIQRYVIIDRYQRWLSALVFRAALLHEGSLL